jgi:hypothetical protein
VFNTEQFRHPSLCHSVGVIGKQLTNTQLLSVSCPTCGVAAGMRCQLYSGAPRAPHVNRKLSALGITGRKASHRHNPEK